MKQMIISLFLLTITALPALAAPTNTSGPWGIDAGGFRNLSTALASPATAGKTVVVSKPMATNNLTLPADRHIRITRGGSINPANGTIFNFGGQIPEAGAYTIFGGSGTIAGVRKVIPNWWGAQSGEGKSSTIRDANTAAINTAFGVIRGAGTLDISHGPYEVSGALLFGTNTPNSESKTSIIGNDDEYSKIVSHTTNIVMETSGLSNLRMSGIRLEAPAAAVGLFSSRTGATYETSSHAGWMSLDKVYIHGSFSKAAFITLGAEILRVTNSQFWNSAPNGKIYASSKDNGTLAVTSNYTLPPINQDWTTNTDIKFDRTLFWSANTGQSNIWLESQFDGTFDACTFITQAAAPGSGNKLVDIVSNYGGLFSGKLNITNSLFESTEGTSIQFGYIGAAGTFYDISFSGNTFLNVSSGGKLMFFSSLADSAMYRFNWYDNAFRISENSALEDLILLPSATVYSKIHAPTFRLQASGYIYSSEINVASSINRVGNDQNSVVVLDSKTQYGVGPSVAGLIPANYTASSAARFVLGPTTELFATPSTGELQTFDSGFGAAIPGISTEAGRAIFSFYDGIDWRALGAYPGTPASATASGKAGTILYDANYLYLCLATNTWRRIALGPAW